jgi:hypothetical protein
VSGDLPHTEVREVFGCACRLVTREMLIRLKRAAWRPNVAYRPVSRS